MPVIGSRRRPKLQGIVDRWVGVNQRSAVAASTNPTLPSSSSSSSASPNPQQRPHQFPAKKKTRRPLKRASYAGHELSSPSDPNVESSNSLQINHTKYHVEALNDDDQDTTITEQTGELTMFTNTCNGSINTFASLESQFESMLIHNKGLQPKQKVTTRRCSAPPLLGLTVETPSPPPKNMPPTLHNQEDEVEADNQKMTVKKSTPEDVPSSNGSAAKKEEMHAQDAATTDAGTSLTCTYTTSLDSSAADITIPVPVLRKQVSFDPKTRIYLHLHLADFSQEEYNASFLTNEDMGRIQLEYINTIGRLRSQINNNESQGSDQEDTSSEHTPRGLEVMSSTESVQAHRQTKQAAIDAVMDQQDEQFDGEYCDHDRIAVVYMAETSDSVRAACIRGASDATYVNRFVRECHE